MTEAHDGYGSDVDAPPRRPVLLQAVPLPDLVDLLLYFDDMVRELQLIAVGQADDRAAYRLARLAIHHQHEIARARNEIHVQARHWLDQGKERADLVVDLRPSAVAATQSLLPLADAFDEASRSGELLTAPCADGCRRVLEWLVTEIGSQLEAGNPPTPFPDGSP